MSDLYIESDSFVLFLDETGHEHLSDPNYPILGIGGCAMMGDNYDNLVRVPWRQLKKDFWSDSDYPLHAADSRNFTEEQVKSIAKFFTTQAFIRFAAVMKMSTKISEELYPYQAVALAVHKRIEKIIPTFPLNTVHMIFEASDRLDMLMARNFGDMEIFIDGREMPIKKYRMAKSTHEPGLEVADFIIHTAGSQV